MPFNLIFIRIKVPKWAKEGQKFDKLMEISVLRGLAVVKVLNILNRVSCPLAQTLSKNKLHSCLGGQGTLCYWTEINKATEYTLCLFM